jgi:hypothetical protein
MFLWWRLIVGAAAELLRDYAGRPLKAVSKITLLINARTLRSGPSATAHYPSNDQIFDHGRRN